MASESKQEATLSLVYPDPLIIPPKNKHTATVIWMHGLGDSAQGWHQEMSSFAVKLPHVKWILPTAPKRPITCNDGHSMRGWYDIESIQDRSKNKYAGKSESVQFVHRLIMTEIETHKIASHRIVVGGFSQGAALSVYSALCLQQKLASVISCSGYLLDFNMASDNNASWKEQNTLIAMYHAKKDAVVPTQYAKKGYQHLKDRGCNIQWNEYAIQANGGHSVIGQEMKDVFQTIRSSIV